MPRTLFRDADEPEPIDLPPGLAALARSSSPQYTLYRLVRYTRPRGILEIGTQEAHRRGLHALAMRDNGTPVDIVCVDPFLQSGDNDGLATLGKWYEYVRRSGFLGRGVQLDCDDRLTQAFAMLEKQFDLILVDGSHRYDDVRHDFEGYRCSARTASSGCTDTCATSRCAGPSTKWSPRTACPRRQRHANERAGRPLRLVPGRQDAAVSPAAAPYPILPMGRP